MTAPLDHHTRTLEFISERNGERCPELQMSVLLDRLDPVEERRVDEAEDGEAAAHDGAQLREEAAEALALLAVHDAVRRDVVREDGVGHEPLLRVGRVRLEVGGAELVVVGRVLERVAHLARDRVGLS